MANQLSRSIKSSRKIKTELTIPQINAALDTFRSFQAEVDNEFGQWVSQKNGSVTNRDKLLNGGANTAAFTLINEQVRKNFGIFFSGHALANSVASKISSLLESGASVIDPACGAGDLLIACARYYPLQNDYESTLSFWQTKLGGIDLHGTFINTVKSRLKLLATESYLPNINQPETNFQDLIVGDALQKTALIKNFDSVVTNPPYGNILAPEDIGWSKGKTQIAALFMDRILRNSKPGQNIVAVLPDVLRSGSRYSKWRSWVAQKAEILSIDVVGKFDENTDVDVFIIHLVSQEEPDREWPEFDLPQVGNQMVKVGDIFNVKTGPVVPHRDKETGPLTPYIDSSETSGFNEIQPIQKRRFSGTPYKGPFVVINRTSSPDDPNRLVSTIVNTTNLVMVENHLIILQPPDGRLSTCRKLVNKLKNPSVLEWINQRIRCRHLTVTAIKDIPINWNN